MNIGPTELILILIIALIVFGPKRLPEVGRTIGKTLREFRRASQDLRDEFQVSLEDEPQRSTPSPVPPQPAGDWPGREASRPAEVSPTTDPGGDAGSEGGPERSG